MSALNRLALDGGTPRLANSPVVAWPQFTSDDDVEVLRAANRSLGTDGSSSRFAVRPHAQASKLERTWGGIIGRDDVIACTSGVVAAGLVVTGLELDVGDEVIMAAGDPSVSAFASLGMEVVQVDIDPETLHIDPVAVGAAISGRTRAVVVVDRFGTTADYRAIERVCEPHGVVIIEDGSQSMGATLERRPVGALGLTSICVLPDDVTGLTLGAGALYATDDPAQGANAQRAMLIDEPLGPELFGAQPGFGVEASWGSLTTAGSITRASAAGMSAMSEVDAAFALSRLAVIDEECATRSANGTHLRRALESVAGIWMPQLVRGATHSYRRFPIVVVPDELGLPESAAPALRATMVDCMTAEGLWIDSARPLGCIDTDDRFPVGSWALDGGLILGRTRSPFTKSNGTSEMDRIADCFAKILIDNVDRVRQLTMERARTSQMT